MSSALSSSAIRGSSFVSSGPSVRLSLLGGFELVHAEHSITVPEAAQRLLVYLAIHDRPQTMAAVAGELWIEKDEPRALANLRSSLWRLSRAAGLDLVTSNGCLVGLDPGMTLDIRDAEEAGWRLVREGPAGLADCDPRWFFDDLLPGWYDDWVVAERERLNQLRLRFLDALCRALVQAGRTTEALDIALRLVAADPYGERSQDALIRVYLAEGNLGSATRHYADYDRVMRQTFGCPPTAKLGRLLQEDIASR
jgi:DNA-binding SARP family transcriptional activator